MVMLAGLFKMELPVGDILLCDGGFVDYNGEQYNSSHPAFGTIESLIPINDDTTDNAPDGQLIFLPANNAPASFLANPAYQDSRLRFWIAEIDETSGTVIGEPELMADLMIDTTVLTVGEKSRKLIVNFGSYAERFFLRNRANGLTKRHHNLRYPDERGLDNANGVTIASAWGTDAPPRGGFSSSSGGGGVRGFGFNTNVRLL